MRRVWTVVSYVGYGIAVLGLVGVFGYSSHFGNRNPTAADASSGRIHPYNFHGRVVYLNNEELMRIRLSEGALIIGGLCFAIAGSFGGLFRSNR